MLDIPDETNIYGLVMEGIFWRKEQSILACYSTGFVANYMISQGGKVGKYYREGDMSAICDIIDIYDSNNCKLNRNRYPIGYPILKNKVPKMVNLLIINEILLIRGSLVQVQKGEHTSKRVIL